MAITRSFLLIGLSVLLLLLKESESFVAQQQPNFRRATQTKRATSFAAATRSRVSRRHNNNIGSRRSSPRVVTLEMQLLQKPTSTTTTSLSMYNLPPGKNDNSELGDILTGVGGIVLTLAFFASPLGGLFFSIVNSFFALAFITPLVLIVGFNVWQYFNTISGPCPSCGAPLQVVKTDADGTAQPSICLNCGAIVQANYENTAIDNITGKKTIDDSPTAAASSPFGGGVFDIFGGEPTTTTTTATVIEERTRTSKKPRRDSNVIDVEVERDEPFR